MNLQDCFKPINGSVKITNLQMYMVQGDVTSRYFDSNSRAVVRARQSRNPALHIR